jgi:hypothetical protein
MTAYRCYLIAEDGKIKGAEVIQCPTDAAALEQAQRRLAGCGYPMIEVWHKAQRIGIVGDTQRNYAPDLYAADHSLKSHAASVVIPREVER